MMLFPEMLFFILIYGSVIGSALGGLALIVLLGRDWHEGRLW